MGERDALELARYELTTLSGLYAHDGNPDHIWRLDTTGVLAKIDAALQSPPTWEKRFVEAVSSVYRDAHDPDDIYEVLRSWLR